MPTLTAIDGGRCPIAADQMPHVQAQAEIWPAKNSSTSANRESAARQGASGSPNSLADDVRAAHDGDHLVEGDAPAHALAAETAIARQDQPLRRDVLQRAANQVRDLLGTLDLQVAMVDHADGDLLVGDRRPIASRSMPSLVQHSKVRRSTSSLFRCGSAFL